MYEKYALWQQKRFTKGNILQGWSNGRLSRRGGGGGGGAWRQFGQRSEQDEAKSSADEWMEWPRSERPTPYEVLHHERERVYVKRTGKFYALVKQYHPDGDARYIRKGFAAGVIKGWDNEGENHRRGEVSERLRRLRMILAADALLSDAKKRDAYDRYGVGWVYAGTGMESEKDEDADTVTGIKAERIYSERDRAARWKKGYMNVDYSGVKGEGRGGRAASTVDNDSESMAIGTLVGFALISLVSALVTAGRFKRNGIDESYRQRCRDNGVATLPLPRSEKCNGDIGALCIGESDARREAYRKFILQCQRTSK